MAARDYRKLYLVDIAVPRDIEFECMHIEGIDLVNIDCLQAGIDMNRQKRMLEMKKVRTIVQQEVTNFLEWLETLKVKPLIQDLRNFAEQIRESELSRVYNKFETNFSERDSELLQDMTRRIVNKMLHMPISQIRAEAVAGNEPELSTKVKHLFGL
jgi:glutamyl-tRNA reductase